MNSTDWLKIRHCIWQRMVSTEPYRAAREEAAFRRIDRLYKAMKQREDQAQRLAGETVPLY